jgi:hypothetical protein
MWGVAAVALMAAAPAQAADIEFKPIDTQKLVVQPSKVAAGLAASTINLVGQTTANTIEKNGYFKTFQNLFKKTIHIPETQAGPSALPTPTMFSSTQYKSFNNPLVPAMQSTRR